MRGGQLVRDPTEQLRAVMTAFAVFRWTNACLPVSSTTNEVL